MVPYSVVKRDKTIMFGKGDLSVTTPFNGALDTYISQTKGANSYKNIRNT